MQYVQAQQFQTIVLQTPRMPWSCQQAHVSIDVLIKLHSATHTQTNRRRQRGVNSTIGSGQKIIDFETRMYHRIYLLTATTRGRNVTAEERRRRKKEGHRLPADIHTDNGWFYMS